MLQRKLLYECTNKSIEDTVYSYFVLIYKILVLHSKYKFITIINVFDDEERIPRYPSSELVLQAQTRRV